MILCDLKEHGHGEVEVGARRVAPASIVTRKCIIWRAKVGCSDENRWAA
jgi:hypothetical protein